MSSNYFSTNLKHLRQLNEFSQQSMSEHLSVPRSTLNNWERGTAMPSFELLLDIAKNFKLSVEDIVQIDLTSYARLPEKDEKFKILTLNESNESFGNIELVDITAEAGYLDSFNDPSYIKDLPRIYFPNIPKGHFRGFEISGDSMLPVESGSVVICSYVEDLSYVKDGKSYVVATKDGLVYKRLYKDAKSNAFTMISDNTIYMPYSVNFEEIQELWEFYAFISFNDGKDMIDTYADERIHDMHEKLTTMHRRLENDMQA